MIAIKVSGQTAAASIQAPHNLRLLCDFANGRYSLRGRSDISLLDLLELGLLQPGQTLQLVRRAGQTINATVTGRGTIICNGAEFQSPTTAATAALGVNTNGWQAWRISKGYPIVKLDALRQQARQQP
jgi:hypothetical protein